MNSFAVLAEYCDKLLFLCLSASISLKLYVRSSTILWVLLAVARSCSGGVVIRYVFSVLRLTSYVCKKQQLYAVEYMHFVFIAYNCFYTGQLISCVTSYWMSELPNHASPHD